MTIIAGKMSVSVNIQAYCCSIQQLERGVQWRRQDFVSGGHRFGVVKRPKIINVYRTTPRQQPILPSMRHCISLCVIHNSVQ